MPTIRTDADQSGQGYQVAPIEFDDGDVAGDFRLLTIKDHYARLMLEDEQSLEDAATGWDALGHQFFHAASALRSSWAVLAETWASDAATLLGERVTAAAASFDAWGYVAAARAYELIDLARELRNGKTRLEQLFIGFNASATALMNPPPDVLPAARRAWTAEAAGDPVIELNLRTWTQRSLDEVVNPLANRFSEAALSFTVAGSVYAGPTDAAIPSDETLAALHTGAWLPDLPAVPPVPGLPALRSAPSAPSLPGIPQVQAAFLPPALPAAPSPTAPGAVDQARRSLTGAPVPLAQAATSARPGLSAPAGPTSAAGLLGRAAWQVQGLGAAPQAPGDRGVPGPPAGAAPPPVPRLPGRSGAGPSPMTSAPPPPSLPGSTRPHTDAPAIPGARRPGGPTRPAAPSAPHLLGRGTPGDSAPMSPPAGSSPPPILGRPRQQVAGSARPPARPTRVHPHLGGGLDPSIPSALRSARTTGSRDLTGPPPGQTTTATPWSGSSTTPPAAPARPAARPGTRSPGPASGDHLGSLDARTATPARADAMPHITGRPAAAGQRRPADSTRPQGSPRTDGPVRTGLGGQGAPSVGARRTGSPTAAAGSDLGGRTTAGRTGPTRAEERAAERARRRAEWADARRRHGSGGSTPAP